jgi:hypothetical protein
MSTSRLISTMNDFRQPYVPEEKSFKITLRYDGKEYSYTQQFKSWDECRNATDVVYWMYEEGNYACDCNRSLFIGQECDEDFPEMPCGDTIELVSIEEVTEQ